MTDDIAHDLRAAYAWGRQRTQSQDVLFLANELVEIAARALSLGINDPYMAMNCLDWLRASLIRLAWHDIPDLHRFDGDGRLRIWAPEFNFETLARTTFDQLRPYFAHDRNASLHMFRVLGDIGVFVRQDSQRQMLRDQADALLEAATAAADNARDRTSLDKAHRHSCRLLDSPN